VLLPISEPPLVDEDEAASTVAVQEDPPVPSTAKTKVTFMGFLSTVIEQTFDWYPFELP